jgi:hypothetical protein
MSQLSSGGAGALGAGATYRQVSFAMRSASARSMRTSAPFSPIAHTRLAQPPRGFGIAPAHLGHVRDLV